MKSLSTLRALDQEQSDIQIRLKPLNDLMAAKQGELTRLRSDVAAAECILDEAVKRSATVAAMQALGTAGADEAKAAQHDRQAAQKAHSATLTASSEGTSPSLASTLIVTG